MCALTDPIDIHVSSRSVLDERLEAAVRHLQGVAMLNKSHGILVTRHGARPLHSVFVGQS
ncbi:hypothetical protein AHiyo6_05940 [Arthrobacter sp. Hiyo6]|jgi:hypothetical protein|nr:hypothetical protein AHiyo6_05940 [Arthrobacter sp. Hiyo6]